VKQAEALGVEPPVFQPTVEEWDAWMFSHARSRQLHLRAVELHKDFLRRLYFNTWRFFAMRSARLRFAWLSAGQLQVRLLKAAASAAGQD
jgi:hypothetical protein